MAHWDEWRRANGASDEVWRPADFLLAACLKGVMSGRWRPRIGTTVGVGWAVSRLINNTASQTRILRCQDYRCLAVDWETGSTGLSAEAMEPTPSARLEFFMWAVHGPMPQCSAPWKRSWGDPASGLCGPGERR